jgi:hypothetical protein
MKNAAIEILRVAFIGAAMLAVASLVEIPPGPALPALTAIATLLAALIALVLFSPNEPATLAVSLGWCAIATLLAGNWLLLNPVTRALWPDLPNLLMGTFLFSALCLSAARLLGTPLVITVFVVLTLAPIWAAPVAELAGNPRWLTNLIVAVSPASMFAVALDLDLMRTSWFYEHSAIGSLRYSYVPWAAYVAALAVLVVAAGSRSHVLQRKIPA